MPVTELVTGNEHTWHFSGCKETTTSRGAAVVLRNDFKQSIKHVEACGDRRMTMKLTAQPANLNFNNGYASTAAADQHIKYAWYRALQLRIGKIPPREFMAIAVDFSAQLQGLTETTQPSIGPYRLEQEPEQEPGDMQESCSLFCAFVITNRMHVCNTWLNLPAKRLCTYKHNNGQEDHHTAENITARRTTVLLWTAGKRNPEGLGRPRLRTGLRPLPANSKYQGKDLSQAANSQSAKTTVPTLYRSGEPTLQ